MEKDFSPPFLRCGLFSIILPSTRFPSVISLRIWHFIPQHFKWFLLSNFPTIFFCSHASLSIGEAHEAKVVLLAFYDRNEMDHGKCLCFSRQSPCLGLPFLYFLLLCGVCWRACLKGQKFCSDEFV